MIIDPKNFSFKNPRRFMVLDGVNGCGKGTLQVRIADYLKQKGASVLMTREPGGTTLGRDLRDILLGVKSERPSALAEAFLFAADRAQHVERKIKPAAEAGSFVISDRYYYSTIAFQGYGRGLDLDTMWKINHLAIQGYVPDLTLLLELDPREGLKRVAERNKQKPEQDSFEQETLDFHQRLHDGFLEIAKKATEPFFIVDASVPADKVFESVRPLVDRWLESAKV